MTFSQKLPKSLLSNNHFITHSYHCTYNAHIFIFIVLKFKNNKANQSMDLIFKLLLVLQYYKHFSVHDKSNLTILFLYQIPSIILFVKKQQPEKGKGKN